MQCSLNTQRAGGYAWISAADTSLLDFPHCELLLIGAKPDTEGAPPCCDLRVLPVVDACAGLFCMAPYVGVMDYAPCLKLLWTYAKP